jgi:SAM-dependent methyltransferase
MKHVLDLGTGNGVVAIDAVRRWPEIRAFGVDLSPVMIEHARAAAMKLASSHQGRLDWVEASAERLPFDADFFDFVVSAFLYQFLVKPGPMLAEARRVLRPGGIFAFVTWQGGQGETFAPDDVAEEVLKEEGVTWEEVGGPPSRRPSSPRTAAAELRQAGFDRVAARSVTLNWRTEADRYLRRMEEDVAPLTFEGMNSEKRDRVRQLISERLAQLAPEAFVDGAVLVSVVARSP